MRFLLVSSLLAGFGLFGDKPIESAHVFGPQGLEGWTLSSEVEGQGSLPMTLVIARKGKIVRQIDGSMFVWKWKFESGGKLVAFETGPLHFSLSCVLVDIESGKEMGNYDCYHELQGDAPKWVRNLKEFPD